MILVTVGTNEAKFDRLIAALDHISGDEEIIAQCGASDVRPTRATCVDYLPFEDLAAAARRARILVTHAGAGSIILALSIGRRPVVVPRKHRYGEAVDDHQVHFAQRLAQRGLIILVNEPEELPDVLARPVHSTFAGPFGASELLVGELSGLIDASLEAASQPVAV